MLPLINKGKRACQRVFPALFALFGLTGAFLSVKTVSALVNQW